MNRYSLSVCAEMVFTALPFADRVRRIHERGFGVELWGWTGRDPLVLAATGARFTSMTGYLSGDLTTPEGSAELLRTARESIDFAHAIGCRTLNLHGTGLGPAGLPVHPVTEVTEQMWAAARDTLGRVAELAAEHDVRFVLENLNTAVDHPGVPFATAADALALVRSVASDRLLLNLDLYHAQIGEGNLADLIRSAAPYLGEVQVADVPGRCEPGTGEVRWPFLAGVLREVGYDGVVALEAFASDPSVAGSELALASFAAAFGSR